MQVKQPDQAAKSALSCGSKNAQMQPGLPAMQPASWTVSA